MQILRHLFLLLVLLTCDLSAEHYAVIAHKNMSALTPSQIRAIFLKKLTIIDNIPVVPVNLGVNHPLRAQFEKEILKMGFSRLKAYWSKQHYLGQRPPLNMKSQKSVKAFVKKVEGAITYVDAAHLDDNVTVLYRWSK